jgi:hypothetical protein
VATPLDFNVRWSDNTETLRRNLALGLTQIEATKESVDKLTTSLSGENAIRSADRWAQALQKLGGEAGALAGVQSLTTAEQDRATAAIDRAIGKYTALGATAPKSLTDISTALHEASAGTTGWTDILSELGHSWVARIAEGILLRDAIHGIIGELKGMALALPEIALKGAAVADVEDAFKRLTEQSGRLSDTLIGALRTGTHSTITDFELMKTANQDLAAGMNLTDQQFGTLAKGAFALAQATGTDVKHGLEVMNDAMLTGRTRALALLTGKIDLAAAEERFAAKLGSTADHLSAEGKIEAARQAILEAVGKATERLGEQTDGLDERVAQASVSWDNFKENLGKTIATSSVLEAGMSGLKDAIIATFGPQQDALIKAIANEVDGLAIGLVSLAKVGVNAGGAVATEWYALKKVFGDVAQIVQGNALAFEYAALGVAKLGVATSFGQAAQQRYAEDVKRIDSNITGLLVSMKARGDALQEDSRAQAGVSDATSKYLTVLDGLQAKMVAAKDGANAFVGPLQEGAKAQGALGDSTGKTSGLLQASKKDIEEAARAAKAAAALWDEYNSVGQNVYDTYRQLDGRVAEGIANDLRRGVSISTITKAWQVNATQVKAVEAQEKFLASTTDIAAKAGSGLYTVVSNLADGTQPLSDRTLQFNYAMQGLTNDGLLPAAAGFDDVSRAEQAAALFAERLKKSEEALQHQLASVIGLMPDLGNVAHDTMKAATESTDHFHDSMQLAEQALSRLAGVNLAPLFKQFDQFMASDAGKAFGGAAAGFGFGQPDSSGGKFAATAAQTGYGILANATQNSDTKSGQVLSSTARGAEIGSQFAPVAGALIGAGVGAIVGALKVNPEELAARKVLEDFVKGYGSLSDAIEEVGKQYAVMGKSGTEAERDLKAALDASHQSADAEAAALARINTVLNASKQRAADVASAVGQLGPAFSAVAAGTAKTAQGLADLGTQAVTTFAAQVAGGLSVADALKADGPALQSLSDSYKALGLDVDNVALKNLLMQNTVLQGNPELLHAIGGLASEMEALDKLGVLNVDTLEAMERTGAQTYSQLQQQVAAVGGSTKDALIPMQAFLHDAANEAEKLGIPLDDNTQLLIDQSKELGIWKDVGKDATQALNDSTAALNATMQQLIASLNGPGGLTDAFHGIPSAIDVTVRRHYVDDGGPPPDGGWTGGLVMSTGIQHFGLGGFVGRGTDTVPAMLTPGEMVLTRSQQNAVSALVRGSDPGLRDELAGLRSDLKRSDKMFEALVNRLPYDLRHALRGR